VVSLGSMKTIGIKDFQQHAGSYSKRVQQGESFIVYSRSKPVMRISPVDEGEWETVIDITEFRPEGVGLAELKKKLLALEK
jgi:antitoxin (DNA-binding transcriptional repressor) of toxin-antitoxin stability system